VNAIKLPKVGAAMRVPTPRGEAFGVVVAVNRARRVILVAMQNGRHVELRIPTGVSILEEEERL
jgi:hypothetical protein